MDQLNGEIGPMQLAGAGDIDLWLTFYDEIGDAALLDRLRQVLSGEERRQEARFRFADDRKRYRLTRALVRTVLSRYAELAPEAWTFTTNAYGRPAISGAHSALARNLQFNLSHTRGLIALAITRSGGVGVDVECLARYPVTRDLAEHCLAPAELADLARAPRDEYQTRFFEYWTLKESYVKARGMGLSIPLAQFGFDRPRPCTVRLSAEPAIDTAPERWSFWQFRPEADYMLAVCAQRADGIAPRIRIRKIVPTVADYAFPLHATQVSPFV